MPDSLDDYRRKRDFKKTPEPAPGTAPRPEAAVFVVHRHEARNLHYDLRLEVNGALSSWAVPRGFSYDPKEKKLAVRTEDHPIEYESFSGTIPKGQYGAGTMTIWDRGTYVVVKSPDMPTAMSAGEVKVILSGRKLRGEWHLVKTKGGPNHWLLFKSKDRYAGPARDTVLGVDLSNAPEAALPSRVSLEKTGAVGEVFSDVDWLFEMRFDGRRCLAEKHGDEARLRGIRKTHPSIVEGLGAVRAEDALLDGVLVTLDDAGRPSREALDARLKGDGDAALFFYAFDLLHYDGFDLRGLPLLDRKAALRAIVAPAPAVLFVDHVAGRGEELAAAVAEAGLPGMVAKRSESAYVGGAQEDWCSIDVDGAPTGRKKAKAGKKNAAQRRVKLSNLDKVYWPAEGYTKGDLVQWYEGVADVLLPYLKDRPVHMLRYPDGIEGKSFYQRRANEQLPPWIDTIDVESDSKGESVPHMIVNDRDALLYLVNLGSIDLHPWLSNRESLNEPDWTILDLDAKESPFEDVLKIARAAGKLLRGVGLRPFVKTSGASGMHIYVPLEPGYTYEHSRMFCEGVARVLARELKEISTVERIPANRGGKVYLDFGQNRRSQTVVPPYVPRPVRGACVSTPLAWDELEADIRPQDFTIRNVMDRIDAKGDLFRPTLTDAQDLMAAIQKLEDLVRG